MFQIYMYLKVIVHSLTNLSIEMDALYKLNFNFMQHPSQITLQDQEQFLSATSCF
jgi:hypothetical protein